MSLCFSGRRRFIVLFSQLAEARPLLLTVEILKALPVSIHFYGVHGDSFFIMALPSAGFQCLQNYYENLRWLEKKVHHLVRIHGRKSEMHTVEDLKDTQIYCITFFRSERFQYLKTSAGDAWRLA